MRGDGLYRRPGSPYWYTKLRINGRWREISTKKRKYGEAKSERKKLIQDQDEGRLPEGQLAGWAFERVAHQYLQAASIRLRPSSLKKERFFLVRPIREFGSLHCEKITAASIRQLQMNMKEGGCQNSYINLVTGATARVLRFSKTWRRIQDDVNRLPERAMPIARVLTVEEKARLFGVAARNPDWMVAYTAALIAVSTTTFGRVTSALYVGRMSTCSNELCLFLIANRMRGSAGFPLMTMLSLASESCTTGLSSLASQTLRAVCFPRVNTGELIPQRLKKAGGLPGAL